MNNYFQQPNYQAYQNGGQFFFVNSKEEAERWIVSQGQTVYLFNVNEGVFYVRSVDRSGLPQPMQVFSFQKYEAPVETPVQYVTMEEFQAMQKELKSEIKKLKPIRKKEVKKDE